MGLFDGTVEPIFARGAKTSWAAPVFILRLLLHGRFQIWWFVSKVWSPLDHTKLRSAPRAWYPQGQGAYLLIYICLAIGSLVCSIDPTSLTGPLVRRFSLARMVTGICSLSRTPDGIGVGVCWRLFSDTCCMASAPPPPAPGHSGLHECAVRACTCSVLALILAGCKISGSRLASDVLLYMINGLYIGLS